MEGVKVVFPTAEHRECMVHLQLQKEIPWQSIDDNLWPAAYAYNPYYFQKHWKAMADAKPAAVKYLRDNHTKLWTRSQFNTLCKVDYVTNNLAESCNNWVKGHKGMHLDSLLDMLRRKLMLKFNKRRKIAQKMEGKILDHIVKHLKERSRNLNMDVEFGSPDIGEVSWRGGSGYRYAVNLKERTCTCREWQISGKPCLHAIAMITSIRNEKLEDYVDMYYLVEKFRAAYAGLIPALPDKSQWPESSHDFFLYPPLLKPVAGRRKTQRHNGRKGKHKCPICKNLGHHWYTCKEGDPNDIAEMLATRGPPKPRKRKATTETSTAAGSAASTPTPNQPLSMTFPPETSTELAIVPAKKRKKTIPTSYSGSLMLSGSGSNQVSAIPLSVAFPTSEVESEQQKAAKEKKASEKNPKATKAKKAAKRPNEKKPKETDQ
ncbi:LOW QUALITY PROTEIN: hypothetical protein U9M48_001312, partial [Paspalum notatum var. saurae]